MNMDSKYIDELLTKFFDGTTTCAEERCLQDYFLSGHVAPQHEQYRDMFGWYASGMDEAQLPAPVRPRRKYYFRYAAAACAAAVLAVAVWLWPSGQPEPLYYADCYVVLEGNVLRGETEIGGTLDAALTEGDMLEAEIDAEIQANR